MHRTFCCLRFYFISGSSKLKDYKTKREAELYLNKKIVDAKNHRIYWCSRFYREHLSFKPLVRHRMMSKGTLHWDDEWPDSWVNVHVVCSLRPLKGTQNSKWIVFSRKYLPQSFKAASDITRLNWINSWFYGSTISFVCHTESANEQARQERYTVQGKNLHLKLPHWDISKEMFDLLW